MLPTDRKFLEVIAPAAIVDNASFTSNVIDTLGFRYATIVVHIGALDIAVAALKVQESDTKASDTALTSGDDITGTIFGTDANDTGSTSTLPAATADNKFFVFEIDLRGRKRYLDLVLTGGDGSAGTYASAIAILERGEAAPASATSKGVSQLMRV